jgi:hypothetical protein
MFARGDSSPLYTHAQSHDKDNTQIFLLEKRKRKDRKDAPNKKIKQNMDLTVTQKMHLLV